MRTPASRQRRPGCFFLRARWVVSGWAARPPAGLELGGRRRSGAGWVTGAAGPPVILTRGSWRTRGAVAAASSFAADAAKSSGAGAGPSLASGLATPGRAATCRRACSGLVPGERRGSESPAGAAARLSPSSWSSQSAGRGGGRVASDSGARRGRNPRRTCAGVSPPAPGTRRGSAVDCSFDDCSLSSATRCTPSVGSKAAHPRPTAQHRRDSSSTQTADIHAAPRRRQVALPAIRPRSSVDVVDATVVVLAASLRAIIWSSDHGDRTVRARSSGAKRP
jgi:hypothetical protein